MKPQLSLEAFADWCEKQPADEYYQYSVPSQCACAQYQKSLGIYRPGWLCYAAGNSFWLIADGFARVGPYTFGALAARLRAAA